MSLSAALGNAGSGLAVISQGFSVISQNVANANTTSYATEETTQTNLQAGGQGMGVRAGPTQLLTDAALQAQVNGQTALAGNTAVTDGALGILQSSLGAVGAGNDLGSLLGNVQTSFSALLNDPSSVSQQGAVVNAAQQLTTQINTLAGAYGQARQGAQDALVGDVATLNTALAKIGSLSDQIILLQSEGQSTSDLQNQRNAQASAIAGLVAARFVAQPNGDMQVFTDGGAQLATRGGAALAIGNSQVSPTLYYPGGGLPGITIDGQDVTNALGGGAIGAQLALRDTILPTYTGELDEFSQNLAGRFSAQGLNLFTDGQGNVPASGGAPAQANYLGFSSSITVNPAVAATPSLVRDGTQAVAGSPTGASAFTPNPGNEAGFSMMIERVLNYALGPDVQAGVAQTPGQTTGLGASGTLSAGFGPTAALGDYATALTASQASDSEAATNAASDAKDTQTALSTSLQKETGVNMDNQLSQMVELQNAYGANAKVISTIQEMFSSLLQAVQG